MTPEIIAKLTAAAKSASENAYPRYSQFHVGAAVLGDDGQIYVGCNVENAAFGSTSCAEANAIANAVVNGVRKLQAVFIYTPTERYTYPCGNCRQIINEFAADTVVFSKCLQKDVHEHSFTELLPHAYDESDVLAGHQA